MNNSIIAVVVVIALVSAVLMIWRRSDQKEDAAEVGKSWNCFRLSCILPITRIGGNPDYLRSAFGRYIGEAVFWTPAALLSNENIRWSLIDKSTAKKYFQLQLFGGYISEYQEFNGFRLLTKIEVGNFFGTSEYFPFYKVHVTDIHFPVPTTDHY